MQILEFLDLNYLAVKMYSTIYENRRDKIIYCYN